MKRLVLAAAFTPLLVISQTYSPIMPPHTIRAVGEATITAKPNEARISVGVTTQTATADEAVRQNAEKTEAVITALKTLIGASGTIQTANYSVAPQYRYEQGQPPVITGYEANHIVDLTLNDITLAGKVIDAASKSGANGINRIEFTLKDDAAVREQAIGKATGVARANAEAIAKALGLSVIGVFSAETTEAVSPRPIIAPMAKAVTMQAAPTPTQLESGTIEVHASVTVYLSVK
jgi:uncharacterized protein